MRKSGWGADMTLEDNPYEVGLDALVDEGKRADYVGREALRRIRTEGVRRRLAGIEIEGERLELNATRWTVKADGAAVGRVTSAIWSPRLRKNIGYAMVPVAHASQGSVLTVEVPGAGERRAKVVAKPFIDPKKEIPKL